MAIKYGMDEMKFMSLLEQVSGVSPKDVIVEEARIIFVIPEGTIARCIGKGGIVIKKLENILKKKVKMVEFSTDLAGFIKNLVHPMELMDIQEEDGVVTISAADHKTRGILIGRAAQNLRGYEAIIKRFFPIKELKVA